MAFILVTSEYERVPASLCTTVSGFADSIEYRRLSDDLKKLPGLVCAAFSQFLMRLQEAELRDGSLADRDAESLESAFRAVDALCG
jgi:hypothetical protein